MEFIEPLLKILLINLILSGDNAIVIAMASRNLPEKLKQKAVFWGTIGAVLFRIIFTVLMIYLLKLPFIHLIGGLLLLFVAYKLLVDDVEETDVKTGGSLRDAIVIIIFADLLMSLDNVLAIVAASNGNILLIMIGIIISIPIILFASQLILTMMDKYPFIVYFGAALLAWTAGEMIVKEEIVQHYVSGSNYVETTFFISLILITLVFGSYQRKRS